MLDPRDTIVALASAPGPGARAILRYSGDRAWDIAAAMFLPTPSSKPAARTLLSGQLQIDDDLLPADLYFWPAPRSYTGQDVVEVHTLGCPPLVELAVARALATGARAAQPGEFTLRAFLAGKLDLTRAEAVLGVTHAGSRDELRQSLAQLAGNLARPLDQVRDDLLNLLADVEAGLDFTDEDLQFVSQKELLDRLTRALAQLVLVQKQLDQRSTAPRPFRVVLAGPPNVGKSSLFNALTGKPAALVCPEPGTTRDYLIQTLTLNDVDIELIDTAGLRPTHPGLEADSQSLGQDQARAADLVLGCREAIAPTDPNECQPAVGEILEVITKCDLVFPSRDREGAGAGPNPLPDGRGSLKTSAKTGVGLPELRRVLADRARAKSRPALAPSSSRCRAHVDACLRHLRQAHAGVLDAEPAEVLALELRGALDELGALVGAVFTDDLLDRIFSRFCIGK